MLKASNNRFAVFLLSFVIASFLQLNWKAALGWSPEFVMALFIICGFYLNLFEMLALSAAGIFIFNWRPEPGWEVLFFFSIPFMVIYARRFLPWHGGINNTVGIIFAVSAFYAISDFPAVAANISLFSIILGITAVFGAAVFQFFSYFYKISPI
ncbi:MAG TPA: hypothetical protein VMV71_00515 [Candidatus Paceibacterota bacterium]|nr:hypothetical protein [Candidatus Paceibacterota bacterium]